MPAKKTQLFIESLPLTTARISGIGHVLVSLVNEMSQNSQITGKYEIVLFTPKGMNELITKHHQFSNVSYAEIPLPKRLVTWSNFLGFLPKIDRWLGAGIYIFANYTNYPLSDSSYSATYVHDLCFERYPELVSTKVRSVLHRYVPKWVARTNKVLAVSQFTQQEFTDFFPTAATKVAVVPGGVDLKLFSPQQANEVTKVKQKYGLPDNYVLFLSNLEPRKNVERLVNSYAQLPSQLRNQRPLVLVGGDSWLSTPIHQAIDKAKALECKIIQLSKYVEDADLPALHSAAVLLVQPSIYEGFGLAPLQAMACGTPVLVSNTSSLPEVCGDAAVYTDPYSEDDIQDKLQKILTDKALRSQMRDRGFKRSKEFTWAKAVDKLLDSLESAKV